MRSKLASIVPWTLFPVLATVLVAPAFAEDADPLPENLAPKATVSANSEYSEDYLAKWAVDGVVPPLRARQDQRHAWCVRGAEMKNTGQFTLTWKEPVTIGEIIYYGRTGVIIEECFKDYEVYLDDRKEPVAKGTLAMKHGPQRISLPKSRARKVRLEFLSAYPGAKNPGASEIIVYREPLSKAQFADLRHPPEERTPEAKALRKKLLSGKMGFDEVLLVKRHPLNISHVYVYHVEGFQPGGGLYIYKPDEEGGKARCIFDAGSGMITSADLSYDGKEIVFAMRQGGLERSRPVAHIEDISQHREELHNYHIFRINIDGTGLEQLTHGPYNNLDPCWLPDGGIAFISDRKPAYAYCYVVTSPVLYRMDRDGSRQIRLSANYLMDFTPSVLEDGRIIYTRWEYVDRPACPIQSLWAINPDGTGLTGVYGNRVITPGTFMDAQPVPGTNKVIATATNHNGSCRGGIVAIDPAVGANAREAVKNLTPEIDIDAHRMGAGPFGNGMLSCGIYGMYEKPFALDSETFLVSKGGTIQLRDFEANAVSLIYPAEDGLGYYCPQPIRQQKLPPVLSGNVMDRKAVLPEDGSVTGSWATLFMQDVYNGLTPEVERGEIKQIAVVQEIEKSTHTPQNNKKLDGEGMRNIAVFGFQFPLVSCGATYAPKRVWGFADVAEDGSAAFQVPSEVPIYFLALDDEGRAVQRMRSFTHLMPGEVQGCVGCHADRNSATPRGGKKLAMPEAAQKLQPPEWGVTGFSYPRIVQGVFDRHCVECHNAQEQPGEVDLSGDRTDFFNVSYDVLCRTDTQAQWNWIQHGSPSGPDYDHVRGMSPYVEWIWTINGAGHNVLEIAPRRWGSPASKLADIIRTGHPDENGEPRVDVPDAERRRVYLWIDLNIPYYGTSSSNHKARLGSRRMMPRMLEPTLQEVAARRCVSCHEDGLPRKCYTRIENPQDNNFLLAPLAKEAGGTEKCGKAIFESTDDPDYRKILATFSPIHRLLEERPRADMEGYVHQCEIDREVVLDQTD
jgi:hypothetical protein